MSAVWTAEMRGAYATAVLTLETAEPSSLWASALHVNSKVMWTTTAADTRSSWSWSLESFYGYSDWAKPQEYPLPLSVPVFGFNMAMSTEQLNKRCADWGYAVGSNVQNKCT